MSVKNTPSKGYSQKQKAPLPLHLVFNDEVSQDMGGQSEGSRATTPTTPMAQSKRSWRTHLSLSDIVEDESNTEAAECFPQDTRESWSTPNMESSQYDFGYPTNGNAVLQGPAPSTANAGATTPYDLQHTANADAATRGSAPSTANAGATSPYDLQHTANMNAGTTSPYDPQHTANADAGATAPYGLQHTANADAATRGSAPSTANAGATSPYDLQHTTNMNAGAAAPYDPQHTANADAGATAPYDLQHTVNTNAGATTPYGFQHTANGNASMANTFQYSANTGAAASYDPLLYANANTGMVSTFQYRVNGRAPYNMQYPASLHSNPAIHGLGLITHDGVLPTLSQPSHSGDAPFVPNLPWNGLMERDFAMEGGARMFPMHSSLSAATIDMIPPLYWPMSGIFPGQAYAPPGPENANMAPCLSRDLLPQTNQMPPAAHPVPSNASNAQSNTEPAASSSEQPAAPGNSKKRKLRGTPPVRQSARLSALANNQGGVATPASGDTTTPVSNDNARGEGEAERPVKCVRKKLDTVTQTSLGEGAAINGEQGVTPSRNGGAQGRGGAATRGRGRGRRDS